MADAAWTIKTCFIDKIMVARFIWFILYDDSNFEYDIIKACLLTRVLNSLCHQVRTILCRQYGYRIQMSVFYY